MIVVSDSSPLNYLVLIGQVHRLPELWPEVWIPDAVSAELCSTSAPSPVRLWASVLPDWVKVKTVAAGEIEAVSSELDMGERHAISLARSCQSLLLLIDDKAGRQEAGHLGIAYTGTLGVLLLMAQHGLVSLAASIEQLRSTNFRVSEGVIEAVLRAYGR